MNSEAYFATTKSGLYNYVITAFGIDCDPNDPQIRWRLAFPVVISVFEIYMEDSSDSKASVYIGTRQFRTTEEAIDWIEELD